MRKPRVLFPQIPATISLLAAILTAASAHPTQAGANPGLRWGAGAITAAPHYPIPGELTRIAVIVTNTGDAPASNVQVKLSHSDWGLSLQGWQEIKTIAVPSIPAGGEVTVQTDFDFQSRTHSCLEARIVGADQNADPNDDRSQLNLETMHAGEKFAWRVPLTNKGEKPLSLQVVASCKGKDGKPFPANYQEESRKVDLGPGDEYLHPVAIDLSELPVGQTVDFELNAYDLGAGDKSRLPQNRNHVVIRIMRASAKQLQQSARDRTAALAASIADKGAKKKLEEAVSDLNKALSGNWVGENQIKKGGPNIFASAESAVHRIMSAQEGEASREQKMALDAIARDLTDSARMLALGNNGNASDIAAGDDVRAAGEYKGAINTYRRAWKD
jgi:hypothetical protein